MTRREFLNVLQRLQMRLISWGFNRWVDRQPEADRDAIRDLRTEISVLVTQIQTRQLESLADELDQDVPWQEEGIQCLQREIREVDDLREIAEFLDRVVRAVPGSVR